MIIISITIFISIAAILLNVLFLFLFQKYLVKMKENEKNTNFSFSNDSEYSSKIMSYPLDWKSSILLFLFLLGIYFLITTKIIFFYSVFFLPIFCFYIYYNNIRKIEITSQYINIFKYSLGSETLLYDLDFSNIRGAKFIYQKTFLGKIWSGFNKRKIIFILNSNYSISLKNSSKNIAGIIFDFLELNNKPTIVILKSKYPTYEKRMKNIQELTKMLSVK